jgi:hypothetical protein
VRDNLPPDRRRDPPRLRVWKRVKSLLGSRAGQSALVGACTACERFFPWTPVLWRLYRLAIAGAIYAGFQEGLSRERLSTAAPGAKLPTA